MSEEKFNDVPAVKIENLSRRFGKKEALRGVDLSIPRGTVFGLVGENGAGKTTLVQHVLGLLAPQVGRVNVFGADPVADPAAVLARVGYLSEKRDIPTWMRVEEFLKYMAAFYPKWDHAYATDLMHRFGLKSEDRLRHLSNGQQARAALIAAEAHRPDLLLLDEPSAGLDPVVRRDILAAIIRTVSQEGRTVLFSSHLLDEVERVSDTVGMIHEGKLVMTGSLDEVKQMHRRLTLVFEKAQGTIPQLPGALSCEGSGREWVVVSNGNLPELRTAAQKAGATIVEEEVPSLEDIFVARVAMYRKAGEV